MLAHNLSSWLFKNGILIMVENLQPFIYIYIWAHPPTNPLTNKTGRPLFHPSRATKSTAAVSCASFARDCQRCFDNNCRYCQTSPEATATPREEKKKHRGEFFLCGSHSHVVFFLAKRSTEDMCTCPFVCTITIIII